MPESIELRFTYLRLFLTVAQATQSGGAASLALTFGYRSREAAADVLKGLRDYRREVMTQDRTAATPLSPDFRIEDHFGNDFEVDVRTICSSAVVDPVRNGDLGSQLQIATYKSSMHHEKRLKDDPVLSNWLRSRQQGGGNIIHPGPMPIQ